MERVRETFHFYSADSLVLPESAGAPWVKTGAGTTSFLDDGYGGLQLTSAASQFNYRRKLWPADNAATPARYRDSMGVQLRIRGKSAVAAWASAASPIGLWLDDGARAVGIAVGSKLQMINPFTGVVIATLTESFPWLVDHVFHLTKERSDRWRLWVDGKLVTEAGYGQASFPGTARAATVGWGLLDPGGTAEAVFDSVEGALNLAVPPQERVDRVFLEMPTSVQRRWTAVGRAMLRASVGLFEGRAADMDRVWRSTTSGRTPELEYSYRGDKLPSAEPSAWSIQNPGGHSVVRERVRYDSGASFVTGVVGNFTTPTADQLDLPELCGRWSLALRSSTPDAAGRVGPYIQIRDSVKRITADLVRVPDSVGFSGYGWVLTDGATAGPVVLKGTKHWRVDPFQPHTVELVVLGASLVLLLVDGHIVDRVAYSAFDNAANPVEVELAVYGTGAGAPGPTAVVDTWDGYAGRRWTDLARRPLFLQDSAERLIFVGGCERNDELQRWKEQQFQVQELRGTVQGITLEVNRLACTHAAKMLEESVPGDWVLEVSWPDITPIWLEFPGDLVDGVLEFPVGSPNFSPQELADLAARYLLPRSSIELEYFACLATTIQAVVVGATLTLTVDSSEGFEVGDTVTIRNAADTVREDTTVLAVPSRTSLEVTLTAGTWVANDVVRKILAKS